MYIQILELFLSLILTVVKYYLIGTFIGNIFIILVLNKWKNYKNYFIVLKNMKNIHPICHRFIYGGTPNVHFEYFLFSILTDNEYIIIKLTGNDCLYLTNKKDNTEMFGSVVKLKWLPKNLFSQYFTAYIIKKLRKIIDENDITTLEQEELDEHMMSIDKTQTRRIKISSVCG